MDGIRRCRADERSALLHIVNAAAERYRGIIPNDCWHDPYMSAAELTHEINAGVAFWGIEADGLLVGVMGVQRVRDAELIRHAYVLPREQGNGIGGRLLAHLCAETSRDRFVGTWAAADWAIRFYRRHGFTLVDQDEAARLLRLYWTVPDRQIETSVVLTKRQQRLGTACADENLSTK